MTSYTAVLLAVSLVCVANSLPSNRRQWFYPVFDRYLPGECIRLNHPCNEAFNRTDSESYAKFPNTRGMTLDASMREFNDFFPPLNDNSTDCYLALWSLLCFHYFPQCHPSLPLNFIVTPCRETCERARNRCGDYLMSRNISWPEHMNCVNFNPSHEDSLCINRTADPAIVDKVNLVPTVIIPLSTEPTSSERPTSTTQGSTGTNALTTAASTSTPSTTIPTTPPSAQCHSRCNFRRRATGGTFKKNDYTFAANVTILNSRGSVYHTFLAKITRLWILSHENCSRYENHSLILIRTSYSHCTACPNFNTTAGGNVYLVSGYCNERGLYLPPNDSLVSPWHLHPKYETKLEGWIQNGIDYRAQN